MTHHHVKDAVAGIKQLLGKDEDVIREDAWMPRLCRTEEGAAALAKQYQLQAQRVGGDQDTGEGL